MALHGTSSADRFPPRRPGLYKAQHQTSVLSGAGRAAPRPASRGRWGVAGIGASSHGEAAAAPSGPLPCARMGHRAPRGPAWLGAEAAGTRRPGAPGERASHPGVGRGGRRGRGRGWPAVPQPGDTEQLPPRLAPPETAVPIRMAPGGEPNCPRHLHDFLLMSLSPWRRPPSPATRGASCSVPGTHGLGLRLPRFIPFLLSFICS